MRLCCALVLTFALNLLPTGAGAQQPAQTPARPDERARKLIADALDALGGPERVRSLRSILVRTKGVEHRSAEVQGYDPEGQTASAHEETLAALPAAARLSYEHRTGRHDGTVRHRRWMLAGDERTVIDFVTGGVYPGRGASVAQQRARLARRVPHLLLLEAADSAASRSLGASTFDGRPHELVELPLPGEKVSLRLFFDAETRLLSKFEYTIDYHVLGDATVEYVYKSYRRHPRLGWFPSGDAIKLAGNTTREVTYTEVAADSPRAEAAFRVPDQLAALVTPPGTVTRAAEGVYVVEVGGFNVMFVEFDDFVLAAEAPAAGPQLEYTPGDGQPGSSSISEAYIRKIKETVPGKPIRYVAPTHFHGDHIGGARAFMAEGATILTTHANRPLLERMAAAKLTVVPDRFALGGGGAPKIETFARRRVVTDGRRTVELINVGPNPHTREGVVVYLPRERILYQGDLFYFDGAATIPPRDRMTVMPFFARWLKRNRLAPARIYGTHGRGYATMEHVELILSMTAKARRTSRRS